MFYEPKWPSMHRAVLYLHAQNINNDRLFVLIICYYLCSIDTMSAKMYSFTGVILKPGKKIPVFSLHVYASTLQFNVWGHKRVC